MMAGSVVAQPAATEGAPDGAASACAHHCMAPMDFHANPVCYVPGYDAFVVVDSIDCAIDFLVRGEDNTLQRTGRFTTDVYQGRHDLKNILRPQSVSVMGEYVLALVSSQTDSSYLVVLQLMYCDDTLKMYEKPVAEYGFSCTHYAFQVNPMSKEIILVGKTPVGYNINSLSFAQGCNAMTPLTTFHYHVPKQAERIKEADPYGGGLALVAICVVFIALVCICFIMLGYGAIIRKVTEKNENKGKEAKGNAPKAVSEGSKAVDGEVYAAIAAAIYAYEQDLHDEEDTVITIQKVERAWTPWNAKFYNMNQYFSNKK